MRNYILKRLLLIPVTLFGILALNFIVIQFAPGGPIEHVLAQYSGLNVDSKSGISGSSAMLQNQTSKYQGARGVPEDLILELEKQFGFDKPTHVRFIKIKVFGN